MSMVRFSPIALNFGYGFILLVHFLGHPVAGGTQFFCKVPLVEISKKNIIISLTPRGVHYIDRGKKMRNDINEIDFSTKRLQSRIFC